MECHHIPVVMMLHPHNDDDHHSDIQCSNIDDGNCLPSVEEIHSHYRHSTRTKSRYCTVPGHGSNNSIRCGIVVFFIVTIISMAFHQILSSSSSYTNATTTKWSSNYNRTMEYLIQHNISSALSLTTYGTPQYYATSYLADTLQLSIPSDDIDLYMARYVLALDYYHFTNYNQTHVPDNDDENDDSEQHRPFMNFITSGIDICQWNDRSSSSSNNITNIDANGTYHYENQTIPMGVTCDTTTHLPIHVTMSTCVLCG